MKLSWDVKFMGLLSKKSAGGSKEVVMLKSKVAGGDWKCLHNCVQYVR